MVNAKLGSVLIFAKVTVLFAFLVMNVKLKTRRSTLFADSIKIAVIRLGVANEFYLRTFHFCYGNVVSARLVDYLSGNGQQ